MKIAGCSTSRDFDRFQSLLPPLELAAPVTMVRYFIGVERKEDMPYDDKITVVDANRV